MVSSIQLGNFFTANGRTVLGGVSGSGLDTKALMEALAGAKRLPAIEFETKIKENAAKSSALSEFRTLLATLKDASNFLRSPPGVNNAADSAFKYATASLSSNTAVGASTYVSVSAAAGAARNTYEITDITSVARAKIQTTANISVASETAAAVATTPAGGQFQAGTFTLRGQNITLNDGDSLIEVAAKFNAATSQTGISATIVKVSTGTYRVQFSATASGTANDFNLNDVGTVSSDPSGVMSSVGITNTQTAADAVFKFNGIDITRSSNAISDIVSGVTINILQATPTEPDPTAITISINPDTSVARNGIVNLINAYNDIKVFAAKQLEVSEDGGFAADAILSDNGAFRSLIANIDAQMNRFVSGLTAGQPNRLSDIGVTFATLPETEDTPQIRNILNLDETKLAEALASNYDGVRRVFEFELSSSNPNLRVFSRTNALEVSSISLNINPGTNTFEATFNPGGGDVTVSLTKTNIGDPATGYTLTGPAGSAIEGLVLIYSSTDTATITLTATQGIADRVFNAVDDAAETDEGVITDEIEALQDSDARFEEEIARIDKQVELFREQLLSKFQALEAAISRINTLLQSLEADASARNNS
ncbi:MAG: flagellar filament capping protein FliD [Alphaproteobacteria bacterium]